MYATALRKGALVSILLGLMAIASPAEAKEVCAIAGNGATFCFDDGSGGVDPGTQPPGYVGGGNEYDVPPAPRPPVAPAPAPAKPRPAPAPVYTAPQPVHAAPKPAARVYRPPVATPIHVAPVQPQPVHQVPAAPAPMHQVPVAPAPMIKAPAAKPIQESVAKPAAKPAVKKVQPSKVKPEVAARSKTVAAGTRSSSPSPSSKITGDAVAATGAGEVRTDTRPFASLVIGGGLVAAILAAFRVFHRKRSKDL